MSVESDLFTALRAVCARVYPDIAPVGTTKPYVTYQQYGGEALTFLGREVPSKRNAEFQVSVWSSTRAEAISLMLQIEAALIVATSFQASPLSAFASDYDHDNLVYSARQDFTIWGDR